MEGNKERTRARDRDTFWGGIKVAYENSHYVTGNTRGKQQTSAYSCLGNSSMPPIVVVNHAIRE